MTGKPSAVVITDRQSPVLMVRPYKLHPLPVALLTIGALLVVMLPSTAFAEAPLELSFVNAAAKGGDRAHSTIKRFLDASDDINLTAAEDVWDEAEKLGLEEKDFRSSALREDNAENFRTIMKNLDIEALLILDVFSRGRKLQVVVIGPSGTEVADVREDIRRGRVKKSEAKRVLKNAFRDLVPRVREFREDGGWDTQEEEADEEEVDLISSEEDAEEDEGTGDEDVSIKEKAIKKAKGGGGMEEGFRIRLGALIGKRSLDMTTDGGFQLVHESPFVGFGGRVEGLLSRLDATSGIGVSVFGGYAPFTTIFDGAQEFASAYARVGAEVRYINSFSPKLQAHFFGGAEAMSVTIEQNDNYTGNRYISARGGADVFYRVGPVKLLIGGAALPVFSTVNSDEAYGTTGFNFAFEFNGGLQFGITDALAASLNYTLQYYSPVYEEPKVSTAGAGPVTSTDIIHTGVISLGYAL